MRTDSLSAVAQRIVDESLKDRPVKAIVSELCVEVGPSKWDGVITPALVEIVQTLLNEQKQRIPNGLIEERAR